MPSNGDNGWKQAVDLVGSVGKVLTPLLAIFILYLQLAEESRAQKRWYEPQFEQRIAALVDDQLARRRLATKEDIERLEGQVGEISRRMEPIVTYLIRRGVIE